MNKLKSTSISWAIKHLSYESDTDILPKPFEIDVIKKMSSKIITTLADIDISSHKWSEMHTFLVPKDDVSFRTIKQLSPLDAVLYSAIIKEFGRLIEKRRVPSSKNRVFSHRFKPSSKGQFYDATNGWKKFWETSLQKSRKAKYILVTDITDFYNQIYHHTIENVLLEECGLSQPAVTSLKNLFSTLTDGVSRGIPVGPRASHLIAEAALIYLDNYLISLGYDYCRFVDDIHIFCSSYDETQISLCDLAKFLDTHQKLLLNRYKTEIIKSRVFIERARKNLSDDPINDLEKICLALSALRVIILMNLYL